MRCPNCNYFMPKDDVETPMAKKGKMNMYQCPKCSNRFKIDPETLKRRAVSTHKRQPLKKDTEKNVERALEA